MKKKTVVALSVTGGVLVVLALIAALVFVAIVAWLFFDWAFNSGYDPIVEGEYVMNYTNTLGEEIYAHLTVTPIDHDTYIEANGINVIMDEARSVRHRWYAIECEYSVNGGETVYVQFVNLQRDIYEDPHASQYVDDNGNLFVTGSTYNVMYYDVWLNFNTKYDKVNLATQPHKLCG